jgi:hypothetical protein
MITRVSLLLLAGSIVIFFTQCNLPIDPDTNPEFAKISKENVSSIPDTIPAGARYACTLSVVRRHMIDSITVTLNRNKEVSKLVSGKPSSDTIVCNLDFLQPADYMVSIIVFKRGLIDTVIKNVVVYSTTPVVAFNLSSYMVPVGDSLKCPFVITDKDSNLLRYLVYNNGILIDSVNVLAAERHRKACDIKLVQHSSLQRVNKISITAIDEDNQFSIASKCTVTIVDTLKPVVHFLPPYNDTLFTITSLPCSLVCTIQDNWEVDSLVVSGFQKSIPQNDTLRLIKTSLDSGTTRDSIEVWDRGGNRTILKYAIVYNGIKHYPPKLKPVYIPPVYEHSTFDTVTLDNLVTITDTLAAYTKDSLKWTITADSSDPILRPSYDSLRRTFYVNVQDTEIIRNRFASYSIKVTDPKGLSSETVYLQFLVLEKNDPPVIKISNQSKLFNTAFDTLILANCAYDPDPSGTLNWRIERGTYFMPDSIMFFDKLMKSGVMIPVKSRFSGKVAIIPDTTKTSKVPITTNIVDSLKFTVTDGELTTSKYVKFAWNRFGTIFTFDSIGTRK